MATAIGVAASARRDIPSITIEFSHSQVGTLYVETGANLFSWGYRLNTQTFPTYAGEVIQVLSAYIDNLSIEGEVRNYKKMEEIYAWFVTYFQVATQGVTQPSYSEEPVRCVYNERGWDMLIRPINLPNMHYGRDVVVPSWKIEAAIIEVDPDMSELTVNVGQRKLAGGRTQMNSWDSEFDRLTSDIGYREANPFSDSHGVLTKQERKLYSADLINTSTADTPEQLIENYNNLLANYENGDFSQGILRAFGNSDASMPATKTDSSDSSSDDSGDSNTQNKHG